ncbi:MAG: alpha/beta hydrolase [Alphaproteobacteria bacterium]
MEDRYRQRFYSSEDDLRLYFRDYGDARTKATPVLCLGGLTRNAKDFHDVALHLAPRRILCPDYRGRGRSAYDRNWRHYVPTTYINDVVHLLAATNLHRVIVLGTSFGGLLAMALAVAAPTALCGVILNDIGPEVNMAGFDRILDFIRKDRPVKDWHTASLEMKMMFPALSIHDDAGWLRMAQNTYREGSDGLLHFDWDVRIVKPHIEGTGGLPDMWPMFRALRNIPTLALHGEISDVLSQETFDRMAREKPDLERASVPGVGHAPTLAEPAARDAVGQFLAGLWHDRTRHDIPHHDI